MIDFGLSYMYIESIPLEYHNMTYIQSKRFVDEDPVGGAEYVLAAGAL